MTDELAVWLHGTRAGSLVRSRAGLTFRFGAAGYERWGLRSPVLSVSMPTSVRPYPDLVAGPFFEGLLPEGDVRRAVAYDLRLEEADTFGLLAALGRDCAGALVVVPEAPGELGSEPASSNDAEPVTAREVAARIARLPSFPLGLDERVRVSLAGMQQKLLLTRLGSGWALPTGGAPSTHILKPGVARFPGSVENENFCMRVAARVGLRSASTRVARLGGRAVLVVERFDRVTLSTGSVRRVHQEDVTQALGLRARWKYESSGGPSLRQVAALLREWRAPDGDVAELLGHVVLVVALGDADHHAKNISIVHDEEGGIRLAPLYDVMSTRLYPWVTAAPGMFVNERRDIDDISTQDLVAEGVAWGMEERDAAAVVETVLGALGGAIESEARSSRNAPPSLVRFLSRRVRTLHDEMRARRRAVRAAQDDGLARPAPEPTWVRPYRRDDGTPVRGHWRQVQPRGARAPTR